MYFAAGTNWKYIHVMNIKILYLCNVWMIFLFYCIYVQYVCSLCGCMKWNPMKKYFWHIDTTLPTQLSFQCWNRCSQKCTYFNILSRIHSFCTQLLSTKNHSYFSLDKQRTKEKGYNEMYCYGRLKVFLL